MIVMRTVMELATYSVVVLFIDQLEIYISVLIMWVS